MSEVVPLFPEGAPRRDGALLPSLAAGLSAEAAAAMALLAAVRERIPPVTGDPLAERELDVFGTAVRRLIAVRPVSDVPDAVNVALVDECIVLADLAGQLLHQLEPRRQAATLLLCLQGLAEAAQGPPPTVSF